MFNLILTQTLTHAFRKGGGAFGACGFYLIIVTLFAFALGPEGLHAHAGAVMSVAMLLACVVAMPLMFERDHEDGTLEQFLLWPVALELLVLARIAGHWLAVILPILLLSPLMALFADLSAAEAARALGLLLPASAGIVAVCAVAAALTLGAQRGGLLQALITLPMAVPILIFASTGGQGAALLLSGLALAALPLSCFACAALVRMSVE